MKKAIFIFIILLTINVPAQNKSGNISYSILKPLGKAAEKEDANTQNNIAYKLDYEGKGILIVPKKSFRWYEKAAEQGDVKALYLLASLYHQGIGTLKSYEKAVYWFEKAAEQGHANSQCNLAIMYY